MLGRSTARWSNYARQGYRNSTHAVNWTELSRIRCWISAADLSPDELQLKMQATPATVMEGEGYLSYARNSPCRTSADSDASRRLLSAA
jgi:hypothetical protein